MAIEISVFFKSSMFHQWIDIFELEDNRNINSKDDIPNKLTIVKKSRKTDQIDRV